MNLPLSSAQAIVTAALAHARQVNFKPLCVVVLDARAAVIAVASEDGTSLRRFEVARGKAAGALAFGIGSRRLGEMAVERPHFISAAAQAVGALVPVAGGVLIKDANDAVIGAVGVSGDSSDNDEAAAAAGIEAAGFVAEG